MIQDNELLENDSKLALCTLKFNIWLRLVEEGVECVIWCCNCRVFYPKTPTYSFIPWMIFWKLENIMFDQKQERIFDQYYNFQVKSPLHFSFPIILLTEKEATNRRNMFLIQNWVMKCDVISIISKLVGITKTISRQ